MKAKRIAEIAHEMAQLRAEMDALSADLKDEYGKCAAHLIAKAIIENTLKATPFATATSSDQLRAELTANNIEMNRLTERNDAILSTLRGRGLEPVRVRDDVKCKVRFVVDKPLTNDQLRAGDWYCREVSADVTQLLIDKEISYCIFSGPDGARVVKFAIPLNSEPSKEIIREGDQFYYV